MGTSSYNTYIDELIRILRALRKEAHMSRNNPGETAEKLLNLLNDKIGGRIEEDISSCYYKNKLLSLIKELNKTLPDSHADDGLIVNSVVLRYVKLCSTFDEVAILFHKYWQALNLTTIHNRSSVVVSLGRKAENESKSTEFVQIIIKCGIDKSSLVGDDERIFFRLLSDAAEKSRSEYSLQRIKDIVSKDNLTYDRAEKRIRYLKEEEARETKTIAEMCEFVHTNQTYLSGHEMFGFWCLIREQLTKLAEVDNPFNQWKSFIESLPQNSNNETYIGYVESHVLPTAIESTKTISEAMQILGVCQPESHATRLASKRMVIIAQSRKN